MSFKRRSSRSVNSDRTEKRVSFEDLADPGLYKQEQLHPKDHTIHIEELFQNRNYRPILQRSLPEYNGNKQATSKPRTGRKQIFQVDQKIPRRPYRLPPFKKPTEPLAHALLRTMSYKEPTKRTRLPTIDLVVKPEPDVVAAARSTHSMDSLRRKRKWPRDGPNDISQTNINIRGRTSPKSQTSYKSIKTSSKSHHSAPGLIASDVYDIVIKCGICLKRRRTSPAAGFCRFCDEYVCSSCIYQHRGVLTRSHPVMVFNCDTCKETSVLNEKESGYCVHCRKYYCAMCVLSHCSVTNHAVLEGHDLLDVVYATVHRGFL